MEYAFKNLKLVEVLKTTGIRKTKLFHIVMCFIINEVGIKLFMHNYCT